jgi:hypothetical protein
MQKMWNWVNSRRRAWLGATVGLLCLAMLTLGHAAAEPQVKGKAMVKPVQGQQLSPATPGAGVCRVGTECSPGPTPGKAACQTIIDCPAGKLPVKAQPKPKSK